MVDRATPAARAVTAAPEAARADVSSRTAAFVSRLYTRPIQATPRRARSRCSRPAPRRRPNRCHSLTSASTAHEHARAANSHAAVDISGDGQTATDPITLPSTVAVATLTYVRRAVELHRAPRLRRAGPRGARRDRPCKCEPRHSLWRRPVLLGSTGRGSLVAHAAGLTASHHAPPQRRCWPAGGSGDTLAAVPSGVESWRMPRPTRTAAFTPGAIVPHWGTTGRAKSTPGWP